MVSFFTPEKKEQSKQWLNKGSPGPRKLGSKRADENVFIFFDFSGIIYTHYLPVGSKINAD